MELRVGDAPVQTFGTFIIHLHSPSGAATLQNSHWPDDPATWTPVVNCDAVTGNSGVVLEMAGHCQLVGDPAAKCSLVQITRRGIGA